MEINDFEIKWLYIVDSGRWIKKRDELKKIAEELMQKTKIVEGIIRYYTPGELEEQAGAEKKDRAIIRADNEEIEKILRIFYKSDMDNVDPEYLENLQFFRAKLTTFEINLPGDKIEPVEVRLLLHNSGNIILEFSLKLENMALTAEIINELQILPRTEDEVAFTIPRKVLEDYSLVNKKIAELLKKKPKNKEFTLNLTFHELVWMYWAVISYIAMEEKAKDSKSLHRSLRYNAFNFFPILIFNFPELASPGEVLEKFKAELYMMLSQEIYLKPAYIRPDLIDKAFDETMNLTERTDHALYFSLESCILLYSQKSKSILELIAKKRNISVEEQLILEKLDIVLVQEFLQLQQFTMEMYDYLLSKKSISEMETDELAMMRGRLSRIIEEFYNIKLLVKTSTLKRLEKGRLEIYELTKSLEVLEKKLELVDAAVSSIHNNLMEFLSILIGILVTVGPIIALAIAGFNPIIAACILTGILIGIYFLYKQIYKLWYRRSN